MACTDYTAACLNLFSCGVNWMCGKCDKCNASHVFPNRG
jgi:hypothetical protein